MSGSITEPVGEGLAAPGVNVPRAPIQNAGLLRLACLEEGVGFTLEQD